MGQAHIRLLTAVPGARNLEPIVREFCAQGPGIITALSDGSLRALQSLRPDDCDAEVMPFGSVVCSFASLAGEDVMGLAQNGHYVAAIAAACEDLPESSPFARTAYFTGLHRALAQTLSEISDWGVGPDALAEAAERAEGSLSGKLRSLYQIQIEAESLLAQLGRQLHCSHVQTCVEAKPNDPKFERLLVLAGSQFCPSDADWLAWAANCGAAITVVSYHHPAGAPMFGGASRLVHKLGLEAGAIGSTNALLDSLFTEGSSAESPPAVEIWSTADVLAECEWVVRGCIAAQEDGLAPSEVGIFVRDVQGYAPLLEAAARRFGVPLVVSQRAPLMTNAFVRATLAILEFCASNDVRALGPIVRSSYFAMDARTRRALDEALRSARRGRSRQWVEIKEWAELHREDLPWLLGLLIWREECMAEAASLSVWTDRLRELVGALPLLNASGPSFLRDQRAQSAMQRALAHRASIQRVRQGRPASLVEFIQVCREVWSDADTSIPGSERGVHVTGVAESLGNVRRLFVMGMLEGVFPKRRSEDPVLTDDERTRLSELLALPYPLPTSHDRARAERDEFYMVCAAAAERLVFSYPQTDDERDNVPAFYLTEVQRAAGDRVCRVDYPRERLTPGVEECLADCDRKLAAALGDERDGPLPIRFQTAAAAEATARPAEDPLSPSELRAAMQCPFSFFARHVLKVHSGRRRARWTSLRKVPQTASLATQATAEEARSNLIAALDAELDLIMSDIPEWELALLRSGGIRLIEDWVRREFAARTIWPKDPGSLRTNATFGSPGLRGSMGKNGELAGSVAAISKMEDYSVVHLVESRAPTLDRGSTTKLNERDTLYYGLHLMAAYDKSGAAALEIETMTGKRVLMVLPRLPGVPLNSRVQEGLEVIDLSPSDDPNLSKRMFYEEVKGQLAKAVRHVREVRIEPSRGEHCAWCDYGELCRRSSEFGEEEESPFGADLRVYAD